MPLQYFQGATRQRPTLTTCTRQPCACPKHCRDYQPAGEYVTKTSIDTSASLLAFSLQPNVLELTRYLTHKIKMYTRCDPSRLSKFTHSNSRQKLTISIEDLYNFQLQWPQQVSNAIRNMFRSFQRSHLWPVLGGTNEKMRTWRIHQTYTKKKFIQNDEWLWLTLNIVWRLELRRGCSVRMIPNSPHKTCNMHENRFRFS